MIYNSNMVEMRRTYPISELVQRMYTITCIELCFDELDMVSNIQIDIPIFARSENDSVEKIFVDTPKSSIEIAYSLITKDF